MSARLASSLAVASALLTTTPLSAQLMSKWGHPAITLGWSPYNSTNLGHGNYPGSNGFIPGYGYYPGDGPGTYPWMDGPGTPFDRRQIAPPPPAPPPLPPGAALVVVKLPAEAELWFDETRTTQDGSYRAFVTPPLADGGKLTYRLRVRWLVKDAELTRSETVTVEPGKTATVNLLTADGWQGMRRSVLPEPRVMP